jgi:hypothetical protein
LSLSAGTLDITNSGLIQSTATAGGAGGPIGITLGSALTMSGSSSIVSSTSGAGNGGAITIAAGSVVLDGALDLTTPTAIASLTTGTGAQAGAGGPVTVTASGTVSILNGAMIATTAGGDGAGGNVAVGADTVILDGGADLLASGTGIISTAGSVVFDWCSCEVVAASGTGAGGAIAVTAATGVQILNGASVTSIAQADGPGGAIVITSPTITLDGGAFGASTTGVFSFAGVPGSQDVVLSGSEPNGAPFPTVTGNGGTITVNAGGTLTVTNGASITTTTTGNGAGGAIAVNAGSVVLDGGDFANPATGVFSTVGPTSIGEDFFDFPPFGDVYTPTATGAGGTIGITAGTARIANGATVTALFGEVASIPVGPIRRSSSQPSSSRSTTSTQRSRAER